MKKERVNGDHTIETADFIPAGEIKAYLREGGRLNEILAALLEEPEDGHCANEIIQFYSVVFAILVSIDRGRYITNFLKHESLRDNHLPFTVCPPRFPEAIFDEFWHAQPRFCAATFYKGSQQVYDNERRLPYLEKKRIGEGGSADVYRVRIHCDYNKLHGSGSQVSRR